MLSTRCLRHFERLAVPLRCVQLESRHGASPSRLASAFPCEQRRTLAGTIDNAPAAVKPLLQYASFCLPTSCIQTAIEGFQEFGLTPVAAYVVMGLSLRVACLPLHVYAEKLLAKRIEITKAIGTNIMHKVGEHYKVAVGVDPDSGKLRLDTQEIKIHRHAMELLNSKLKEYVTKHRLQIGRVMCLKLCTAPLWILTTFSIRNLLTETGFTPVMPGFLWLDRLSLPDPYYVLPATCAVLAFLSIYSQRFAPKKFRRTYEAAQVVGVMIGFQIMTMVPACISVYWLSVLSTGLLQTLVLRLPKVKRSLGIGPLPTDTPTPFRDLLYLRRGDLTDELK